MYTFLRCSFYTLFRHDDYWLCRIFHRIILVTTEFFSQCWNRCQGRCSSVWPIRTENSTGHGGNRQRKGSMFIIQANGLVVREAVLPSTPLCGYALNVLTHLRACHFSLSACPPQVLTDWENIWCHPLQAAFWLARVHPAFAPALWPRFGLIVEKRTFDFMTSRHSANGRSVYFATFWGLPGAKYLSPICSSSPNGKKAWRLLLTLYPPCLARVSPGSRVALL